MPTARFFEVVLVVESVYKSKVTCWPGIGKCGTLGVFVVFLSLYQLPVNCTSFGILVATGKIVGHAWSVRHF